MTQPAQPSPRRWPLFFSSQTRSTLPFPPVTTPDKPLRSSPTCLGYSNPSGSGSPLQSALLRASSWSPSLLLLKQNIFLDYLHWQDHVSSTPKEPPLPGDVDWSRFAYSQYATNSAYLCNSLMFFASLHRLGSKADRLLMYPSSMKPDPNGCSDSRLLSKAQDEYGVKLVPVAVQHRWGGDSTWSESYTKLLAFNQTQYDRILALDSDSTLLLHMDELFLLPPAPVAILRAYWLKGEAPLTTALILLQPSTDEFGRVAQAIEYAKGDGFDMEIVNRLYGRDCMVLPHRRYTLLTGEFRTADPKGHAAYLGNEYEAWDADAALREAKFLHFSDWPMPKPWLPAPDATVRDVQPKCALGPGGEEDCRARQLWLGFYSDFKTRRRDVCGQ